MLIVIHRGRGSSATAGAETGFSRGHQPGDVGQISGLRIDGKLRVGKNMLGPQRSVADVVDRIVGGKYVARTALRRSVILPGQAGSIEQVGQCLKIETWKRLGHDEIAVERGNLRVRIGGASPDLSLAVNLERVVPDAAGLRRNRIKVVGKTRTLQRGKHVVGENKVLRVLPVVGNIRLVELLEAEIVTVDASGGHQIEAVHLAAV